jgi:CBS domain-containing protein
MRKLIYLLLLAVVVPFTQSCNSSSDTAKDSFLATLRSDGSKFGFMCILDNMKTAEVTDLKGTYKHTDGDRVMIYGNLNKNTGASGYNYTVDIHQIGKIITDDVKTISTPEEDVYDAECKMSQYQVRRIPVLENNRVVGILTLGDLAHNNKEIGKQEVCNNEKYVLDTIEIIENVRPYCLLCIF